MSTKLFDTTIVAPRKGVTKKRGHTKKRGQDPFLWVDSKCDGKGTTLGPAQPDPGPKYDRYPTLSCLIMACARCALHNAAGATERFRNFMRGVLHPTGTTA
jgi:hypothetical protein